QYENICRKVNVYSPQRILPHLFSVELHHSHCVRMKDLLDLLADGFAEYNKSAHLDPAARRTCTGSDEHDQQQHCLRQFGPKLIICRIESRRGDHGSDLEGRIPESMEHIPVDIQDIHRDDRYGCGYDPKICSELLVFQHALPILEQKE